MAEPTRRRAHGGADKTGMCVNKECENYRQTVNVNHGDFVCPKCGKTLTPIKQGPQAKMWIYAIIGAIVIAAAVAVYLLSQGGSSEPAVAPEDTTSTVLEQPVDTATAVVEEPVDTVTRDTVKSAEPEKVKEPVQAEPKQATAATLPYGKYTGPMKGGKPDGVGGSVAVNGAYTFDLNDGTTTTVSAGDRIENTKFQNGRLVQGEIQRPNGDRKWITLGAANGR